VLCSVSKWSAKQIRSDCEAKLVALHSDLQRELASLLTYFGEKSNGSSKPEDLFGLVVGFSNGLQKAAGGMTRHVVKADKVVKRVKTRTEPSMARRLDRAPTAGKYPQANRRGCELRSAVFGGRYREESWTKPFGRSMAVFGDESGLRGR